jgi:hypothetical protein
MLNYGTTKKTEVVKDSNCKGKKGMLILVDLLDTQKERLPTYILIK